MSKLKFWITKYNCQTKWTKNELGQKPKAKFLQMALTKQEKKKIHNCLIHFSPFLFISCEILELELFFVKLSIKAMSKIFFSHSKNLNSSLSRQTVMTNLKYIQCGRIILKKKQLTWVKKRMNSAWKKQMLLCFHLFQLRSLYL